MLIQSSLQIALTLLIVVVLSVPSGRYLATIMMDRHSRLDPLFDPIDNAIYWLIERSSS